LSDRAQIEEQIDLLFDQFSQRYFQNALIVGAVCLPIFRILSNGAIPSSWFPFFMFFMLLAVVGWSIGAISAAISYFFCAPWLVFFYKSKNLWLCRSSIGLVTGLIHAFVMGRVLENYVKQGTEHHLLMLVALGVITGVSGQVTANWYIRERQKVERQVQALNEGSHPDLEDNEPEVILEATLEPGGQQALGDKGSHPDLEDNEPEVIEATLEPD
jgi:hypothetical protein